MSSQSGSKFSVEMAELMALLLESITFGMFLTLFIILIAVFGAKDTIRLANRRFVLIVATIMMVMSIVHLVIDFVRVIGRFGTADPQGNQNLYLTEISNPLLDSKILIYGLQTLLGDAVLVWRCYIIYNRSLCVIIPTGVVLLGNAVLSIPISVAMFNSPPGVYFYRKGAWEIIAVACFFILTVCLNLFCTVAIVVKLWGSCQRISSSYGRSLFPVMAAIIESGALYTAGVLSFMITFLARSNGQNIPMDVITPLVGVVFCLIVLQIHFQMRVLKPSSAGTTSRSLPRWEFHERAPIREVRGGVVQHESTR